jgi:[protein-PII] uridylyltransferase
MEDCRYRGFSQSSDLTEKVDAKIAELFRSIPTHESKGWSVIAVGGYGRRDMCPFSDIDILLLAEGRGLKQDADSLVSALIYPLWDMGLGASYSVRTIKETLSDMEKDFFLKTSLMNIRFVDGDQRLFKDLAASIQKKSSKRKWKTSFLADLLNHDRKRHEGFGDDAYILEPDIKDGQGGLRDFHSILWMTGAALGAESLDKLVENRIISSNDLADLEDAADFLLQVRYALHEVSGRKQDHLSFEYQERLSGVLGLSFPEIETPVEAFMKKFHLSATSIKILHRNITFSIMDMFSLIKNRPEKQLGPNLVIKAGMVSFSGNGTASFSPLILMGAFLACGRTGMELHPTSRTIIRSSLDFAFKGRTFEEIRSIFLKILNSDYPQAGLTPMLETGVLELFIPEFTRIRSKIQFDVYHVNTVDMHSIRILTELRRLEHNEEQAFSKIHHTDLLMLAALLHDIGKGSGGRHEATGAALAYDIALRLGYRTEYAETVSFLVRNHLLLPHTATRRDISDEKTVFRFARAAGSVQNLCMLYLLSIADSIATGPAAFNDWKGALFNELFVKALYFLEKGELKSSETIRRLDSGWDELLRLTPAEYSGRLWSLPQHYLLYHNTPDIIRHIKLCEEVLKGSPIKIETIHAGGHFRLTVITRDKPGLFADLSCIMACMHLEVLSAKVFTWHNGIAVDTFDVSPPWDGYDEWDRFTDIFNQLSSGETGTTTALSETPALLKLEKKPKVITEPLVNIDNQSSDFFSIIEIRSTRTIDLLYLISKTISINSLSIHRAFITSDADMSLNIFYVVDDNGEKIEDRDKQADIIKAILKALNSGNFPKWPAAGHQS